VTLTGASGARVFVDEARRESLRSPFVRVPVSGGGHAFRIRESDAAEDAVVARVTFAGGGEIALVRLGPTVAFRVVADQLALRDRAGQATIWRALAAREAPGGAGVPAAAFVAWLVAAIAMSGSAPPVGAPRELVAITRAAVVGPLGPYLLARLAFLVPLAAHAGMALASVGVGVLLLGALRAGRVRGAAPRLLAFVGSAPAGVGFAAVGMGGAGAFLEALMATGFATAGLYLVASKKTPAGAEDPAPTGALEERLLRLLPERLGALLVSMERWVIDAVAGGLAALLRATAWTVATADARLVSTPGDAAAARLAQARRRFEPLVGVPLGRIVFAVLGAIGFAALLHAVWPGR
jgi:hypothetical protein